MLQSSDTSLDVAQSSDSSLDVALSNDSSLDVAQSSDHLLRVCIYRYACIRVFAVLAGLVKKRAMLGVDVSSSSLSQLLREAKAEGSARAAVIVGGDAGTMCTAPLNYSRLFDEYHGEAGRGLKQLL